MPNPQQITLVPNRSETDLNEVLDTSLHTPDNQPFLHSPYYNHDTFIDHLKLHHKDFKILSLNCQSLNAKLDQIQILLRQLNEQNISLDALCLQETWLSEPQPNSTILIPGYNIIYQPKHASEHGGLAIYIKDTYQVENLPSKSKYDYWEHQLIKVKCLENKEAIIGNIYRPPHKRAAHLEAFNEQFKLLIDECSKFKNIILTGDFNINLLDINSADSPLKPEFFNIIVSNGFTPKITLPTRITDSSCTLIDNFFCKLNLQNVTSGILTHNISDHQPYFITLPLISKNNSRTKLVTIRSISATSIENIGADLQMNIPRYDPMPEADPNKNYDIFIATLTQSIQTHIPVKTTKFNKHKHKQNPWITNAIIKSIRERDKLYYKLRHSQPNSPTHDALKLSLKLFNKILQKTIRQAKYIHYHSLFEELKINAKKTWFAINEVTQRKMQNHIYPDEFSINGQKTSNKVMIANEFNKYFAEIGEKLASQISYNGDENHINFVENATSELTLSPIDETNVKQKIQRLKTTSSCGYDDIPPTLVKHLSPHLLCPLTMMINQTLKTGIFPDQLKIAKVIPIHKKDDKTVLSNYRPISILPAISKIFERTIHEQFQHYFTENNLFYESQYGFRPKHSTELASLHLTDQITQDLDNNEVPINIYLDLSKAFDTINHKILFDKLRHYGITGTAHKLIKSYLTNRKQYTSLSGAHSTMNDITTGVPQGSILGPLLFIIYINDLPNSCNILTPIIYADDTTLYAKLSSLGRTPSKTLNCELSQISKWLQINKLSLNIAKTKYMIFHKPKRKLPKLTLNINGINIEQCSTFNFLGLTLNQNLTWNDHIRKISLKIARSIGQLKNLKHFLPSRILTTLYNSLILPHFQYSILIWGSQSKKLLKLQKKAIRVITNSKYNAHTNPLFKKLNLLTLDKIYQHQVLNFFFKLKNHTLPPYFGSFPTTMNNEVHHYNTRRRTLFQIRVNHQFAKESLRCSLINIINNTPNIILEKVQTHCLHGFSSYTKMHFINTYSTICERPNCYVCRPTNHNSAN